MTSSPVLVICCARNGQSVSQWLRGIGAVNHARDDVVLLAFAPKDGRSVGSKLQRRAAAFGLTA